MGTGAGPVALAGGTGSSQGHGDATWSPLVQAVVPVTSISAFKKTNTALLVPNALSIRTAEGQKVRVGTGMVLGAGQLSLGLFGVSRSLWPVGSGP